MEIMDLLRSYLNGNKLDLLIVGIAFEALCIVPFVICSFVVADTANAGFNCVLTGFLNIAFTAGSYHVLVNSKAPIAVSDDVLGCFVDELIYLGDLTDRVSDRKLWRYGVSKFDNCDILGSVESLRPIAERESASILL